MTGKYEPSSDGRLFPAVLPRSSPICPVAGTHVTTTGRVVDEEIHWVSEGVHVKAVVDEDSGHYK
eukprot:1674054-Amphidinium_carterae.1